MADRGLKTSGSQEPLDNLFEVGSSHLFRHSSESRQVVIEVASRGFLHHDHVRALQELTTIGAYSTPSIHNAQNLIVFHPGEIVHFLLVVWQSLRSEQLNYQGDIFMLEPEDTE